MHRELRQISWAQRHGLIAAWSRKHPIVVRVNLARLAAVSYDGNDRSRWFDIADRDGYSLRLLYSVADPLPEKEAVVLTALREHVLRSGLSLDLDTRRALGVGDSQP